PVMALTAQTSVMACLVEPLHPAQLAPTLDLAVARFRDALELKRALADRKVIERAKGQVMDRLGMSEEEAFRWLRTRAMNSRAPPARRRRPGPGAGAGGARRGRRPAPGSERGGGRGPAGTARARPRLAEPARQRKKSRAQMKVPTPAAAAASRSFSESPTCTD